MEIPIQPTPRFIEAVDYARRVHAELRKGTQRLGVIAAAT
jgi:hypothetical protein